MKKLKLQLDELRVESFATTLVREEKGTVLGEECTCYTACTCPGCATCDASCNGTCNASCNGTCDATCYGCAATNLRDSCGGFECYTNYRCPNTA